MDAATESILVDLDLDESNELDFKIKVEGIAPTNAKVRLVCESEEVSFMFNGHSTNEVDVVQFVMPKMKDRLQEGTYPARVEVLIDNKYFVPVQFNISFKKAITVVAESLTVAPRKAKQDIVVTATHVEPQQKPIEKQTQKQPVVVETKAIETPTTTLKDIYATKKNVNSEDRLIRELARSFIKKRN